MDASALRIWIIALLLGLVMHEAQAQLPAVPPNRVHLYLLAGQSNMAGRGVVEEADRQTHPRIWVLNRENQWVPAADPLHFDKPDVVGVGPGLAFAREMAKTDTSAIIALIPVAVGGSAIDSWQPGGYHDQTKSHPYDDAMRRAKLALAAGTLRGILWHQGESDSKPELAPTYADKLSRLVQRFRQELNASQVPVVVGTLGDFYTTSTPSGIQINDAIRMVASRERQVACVESTGLTHKGDHIHFDAASAREFGRRYAQVMQTLQSSIK